MTGQAQLGIGTAALGSAYGLGANIVPAESAAALLRDAIHAGVRYLDTAAAYGDAERIVGLIAPQVLSGDVRVCTKLGADAVMSGGGVASLREALLRLGLPSIDTLMVHSADARTLLDPALASLLRDIHAAQLVKRLGASTYGLESAHAALAQRWLGAIQVEHSILNPAVVTGLAERRRGTELVVRSVLCKGLLSSRRSSVQGLALGIEPDLKKLESFAADLALDLPGLAIRFALDSPGVDIVLVGVSDASELETALRAAARAPLTSEQMRALRDFDRSDDPVSHPELWNKLATNAAVTR
ncbi:MAG: aldo/keto reductase [Steroidobacteraceae bacterium]